MSTPSTPPALLMQILTTKINMPEEHNLVILALINRVCNMAYDKMNQGQYPLHVNSYTIHRYVIFNIQYNLF